MREFKGYDGLLYVGDPHAWSEGPGKRIDEAIFSHVVLDKIDQAVNIAIKNNLYLVFLGDLFHSKKENDITLLTKLTRILKKLPEPPTTAEGNHEKTQTKLSDDVALSLLREAGVIYAMEKSEIFAHFTFTDGSEAYLGGTPYGEKLPLKVVSPKKEVPILWVSHHDLDFGETYPGAIEIKEIHGVSMLVNGHIHATKKPMTFGKMRAHNPGNIVRLSIDCREHIPSVWQWKPEQEFELEPLDLVFKKEVFNIVNIEATEKPIEVKDIVSVQQASKFVEKMQQQAKEHDPNKTDDGAYVKDSISALTRAMNLGDEFMSDMYALADETLEDIKNKS